LDAVYRLNINRYRGQKTLEIFFQDIDLPNLQLIERPFSGVVVRSEREKSDQEDEMKNCTDVEICGTLTQ
jgi:hypothetical protein